MKGVQTALFILMILVSAPSFAYLDLSCNPENEPNYEGVDCARCHGPEANWDTLCGSQGMPHMALLPRGHLQPLMVKRCPSR